MKKTALLLLVVLLITPIAAQAVEQAEFGLTAQFGQTMFFGRMGEVIAPDLCFGANFQYGLYDWIAIEFDVLYSEHQQTDSLEIGEANFTMLQTGIGPRIAYTFDFITPYISILLGGDFFSWENELPPLIDGAKNEKDDFDGHGLTGYLTIGLDFLIADEVAVGVAGKGGLASSEFEYYTIEKGKENITAYMDLNALFRLTLIF